jgi:hypothetical protein
MRDTEFLELTAFLERTPTLVERMLSGFTEDQLRQSARKGQFSPLQHVCHLRDLEREGYQARIGRMLHEENPLLADFDGARIAGERDYNSESLDEALRDFAEARLGNVELVKSLPADDLNRPGRFDGIGPITLGKMLLMMKEHDQEHLRELGELSDLLRQAE